MNKRILSKYPLSLIYRINRNVNVRSLIYSSQLKHVNTRNIIYSNISIQWQRRGSDFDFKTNLK